MRPIVSAAARVGTLLAMRRLSGMRGVSIPAIWLVVGVVVAAIQDYFENLDTAGRILSAIVAVLIWPILLFGFDVTIAR